MENSTQDIKSELAKKKKHTWEEKGKYKVTDSPDQSSSIGLKVIADEENEIQQDIIQLGALQKAYHIPQFSVAPTEALCDYHCELLRNCHCSLLDRKSLLNELHNRKSFRESIFEILSNNLDEKRAGNVDYPENYGWWYASQIGTGYAEGYFSRCNKLFLRSRSGRTESGRSELFDPQNNSFKEINHKEKADFLDLISSHFPCLASSRGDVCSKSIITASKKGTVYLWDFNGYFKKSFQTANPLYAIQGSDKDNLFLIVVGNLNMEAVPALVLGADARIIDSEGTVIHKFQHDNVIFARFNRNYDKVLTVSFDGAVKIWDLNSCSLGITLTHNGPVDYATINATYATINATDDKILTLVSGKATLWDFDGNILKIFGNNNNKIRSVDFNSAGDKILIGCSSGKLDLYDLNEKCLQPFSCEKEQSVEAIDFNASDDKILTINRYGEAKLWALYKNPTLGQLFLRKIIRGYLNSKPNKDILKCSEHVLLLNIAKRMQLDPFELRRTWYSLEPEIRQDLLDKIEMTIKNNQNTPASKSVLELAFQALSTPSGSDKDKKSKELKEIHILRDRENLKKLPEELKSLILAFMIEKILASPFPKKKSDCQDFVINYLLLISQFPLKSKKKYFDMFAQKWFKAYSVAFNAPAMLKDDCEAGGTDLSINDRCVES